MTPLRPGDGAVVPTNPAGIAIAYRCPRYGSYVDSITGVRVTEGSGVYKATLSVSPAVGSDRRLTNAVQTASFVPIGDDVAVCETAFGGPTSYTEPRPHRAPGVYYWQVSRPCSDCPGGFEVGPVWRFTVRLGVKLKVVKPPAAYAGIPVLIPVEVVGELDGLRLERRTGSGWAMVAEPLPGRPGRVGDRQVPIVATLPAGKQTLRAVVVSGGQSAASPPLAIAVGVPTTWSPGRAAAGTYRDPNRPSLRFSIDEAGRTIRGFTSSVTASCTSSSGSVTPVSRLLTLPPVAVAPDGRFVAGGRSRGQQVWIQGRVVGDRVSGYAAYSAGSCSGDLDFDARRAR